MRWQSIIVGVDGSLESIRAASLAWHIAQAAGTRLLMVYAVPEVWAPGGLAPLINSPDVVGVLVSNVRRHVDAALGAEIPLAVREALVARTGSPGVVLEEIARESGASLIVVGGRHHGVLARGLGGSTAHHLVRTAPVPVLVVDESIRAPRRMLVATDLSAATGPTVATAAMYADLLDARLRFLHVVEPAKFPTVVPLQYDMAEFEKRSRAQFERLLDADLPGVAGEDRVVRRGLADEEIAEEATAWQADVTVIGSHGKGWIDRLLIGSTTERLLNRLPTSLLVIPINRPAPEQAVRQDRKRMRRSQKSSNLRPTLKIPS